MELRLERYKQNKLCTQSANITKHTLEHCINNKMNATCSQMIAIKVDMTGKAWQKESCKKALSIKRY